MTGAGVLAILPLIIPSVAAVLLVLLISFRRSHFAAAAITLVGLALAFAATCWRPPPDAQQVTALLVMDGYAAFFNGLILAAAAATVLIAYGYLRAWGGMPEEYYVLLLLATIGSQVLVASTHLISFFIGLEILSVSLYGLTAYPRTRLVSLEAGVKYLVLAATSAAFLLFGMALVYAELGTMELGEIISRIADQPAGLVFSGGLALLVVGIGFKLGLVPFHLWVADVYQGAPAPTTAFIATVSKGAIFALLVRYFVPLNALAGAAQFWMFGVLAIASMFAGNLLALLQNNLKRMLAYSSIAHAGYLLIGVTVATRDPFGLKAVAVYAVAYLFCGGSGRKCADAFHRPVGRSRLRFHNLDHLIDRDVVQHLANPARPENLHTLQALALAQTEMNPGVTGAGISHSGGHHQVLIRQPHSCPDTVTVTARAP